MTIEFPNNLAYSNPDILSVKLFKRLDENCKAIHDDKEVAFDFSECTFKNEIKFTELFNKNSEGYKWASEHSENISFINDIIETIKVVDNDQKAYYAISFIFDKAVFGGYPSFDYLRCNRLSFENTTFENGARFRHVDIEDFNYQPRKIRADVTIYHREKADIDKAILRGKELGQIGNFRYRHALEGDGVTYIIAVRFSHRAYFTDAVLDKVQFSFMDERSMSKCFFANSMLEDTKFYNCKFPQQPDHFSMLDLANYFKSYLKSSSMPIVFTLALIFAIAIHDYVTAIIILAVAIMTAPAIILPIFYLFGKILSLIFKGSKPFHHMSVADDINAITKQTGKNATDNYLSIRETYRQLRVNFEKHGDYQMAGEFFYSQRYTEMINFGGHFNYSIARFVLFNIHFIVNGFGERWLRAIILFISTVILFALFTEPNKDFISTKSTPEYFLNAYKVTDNNKTAKDLNLTSLVHFDESSIASKLNKPAHFMLVATTNFKDSVNKYDFNKTNIVEKKEVNKAIYAYDNRFDYNYTEQYIPMLHNDFIIQMVYSLSKAVSPFVSDEKNWFAARTPEAHKLGFTESILLWFFFSAFVLAVKNHIKR